MFSNATLSSVSSAVVASNCEAYLDFSNSAGTYVKSICQLDSNSYQFPAFNTMCNNLGMQVYRMDPQEMAQKLVDILNQVGQSTQDFYTANSAGECTIIICTPICSYNSTTSSGSEANIGFCEYLSEGLKDFTITALKGSNLFIIYLIRSNYDDNV